MASLKLEENNTSTSNGSGIMSPSDEAFNKLIEEHPELEGKLHTCLSDGQFKEILNLIGLLRLEYGSGLEVIKAFQGSLKRIFRLYEEHDKKIRELEKFQATKVETNGNTNTTICEMKQRDDNIAKEVKDLKETEIKEIQEKMGSIETNVALILQKFNDMDSEKQRKWKLKDAIIVAVGGGLTVVIVSQFIIFLWKTFTLGI